MFNSGAGRPLGLAAGNVAANRCGLPSGRHFRTPTGPAGAARATAQRLASCSAGVLRHLARDYCGARLRSHGSRRPRSHSGVFRSDATTAEPRDSTRGSVRRRSLPGSGKLRPQLRSKKEAIRPPCKKKDQPAILRRCLLFSQDYRATMLAYESTASRPERKLSTLRQHNEPKANKVLSGSLPTKSMPGPVDETQTTSNALSSTLGFRHTSGQTGSRSYEDAQPYCGTRQRASL